MTFCGGMRWHAQLLRTTWQLVHTHTRLHYIFNTAIYIPTFVDAELSAHTQMRPKAA